MPRKTTLLLVLILVGTPVTFCQLLPAHADAPALVPHGQSKPPGPALSPQEAIAQMKVPEGFSVELVAAEPDIVNPVAMTFDERGRVWITESLEYPRRDAGPGRDRVKILEDTDGDGRADKFTVFAEGLNIPSGIAVGAGGVWVANSPDILFMQDTDGDDRADKREVVVTGFGRDDTHELPNSLTWGPDGWLYGLNGVFNRSHVQQDGREYKFTAAMFRIHPRTRRFELFCEGTSNPWGIAWDSEGSAFVSACVIDHLWHLTETGYYHRQAGAYPAHTWKIESIVQHKHQQAAYCGIHYFDSDAYPEQYRNRLYMGNIHGAAINCDALQRAGSTYSGQGEPDFLSANDAWFMPVVQKTGPDGCLYVLDWYDRYHCYQDAGRDPAGIDRAKGRLYRIRYKDTPRAGKFDLTKETDEQLVARLSSPNVYFRDIAQRLLAERTGAETAQRLQELVLDEAAPRPARMHALWALVGRGPLESGFHARLLLHEDASFRAWGVRAAGNAGSVDAAIRDKIVSLAHDSAADVRLQVAIAAAKIESLLPIDVLVDVLAHSSGDPLIPQIAWQNLHPQLGQGAEHFLAVLSKSDRRTEPALAQVVPRAFEKLLAASPLRAQQVTDLLKLYLSGTAAHQEVARACLAVLAAKIESGELTGENLAAVRASCEPLLAPIIAAKDHSPLALEARLLAASWQDPLALDHARAVLGSHEHADDVRARAFAALLTAKDDQLLAHLEPLLAEHGRASTELQRRLLTSLARHEAVEVAAMVLRAYPNLPADLHPQVVVLLSSRPTWGRELLRAMAAGTVEPSAVNANQIRRLLATGDESLRAEVAKVWGTLREDRSPDRENIIRQARQVIRTTRGNPEAGHAIFRKVCGNCHKIYGQGEEVGPEITVNGRCSYEQLLSNVLDPSLVIGAAYQARTVVTDDGRVLAGLLVEDNPQRVVLKQQGGKLETIPRSQIDQMETSKLSLMPEDLDKQLQPQELADLFTFLSLDRPPNDPAARWLSGFDGPAARESKP